MIMPGISGTDEVVDQDSEVDKKSGKCCKVLVRAAICMTGARGVYRY